MWEQGDPGFDCNQKNENQKSRLRPGGQSNARGGCTMQEKQRGWGSATPPGGRETERC